MKLLIDMGNSRMKATHWAGTSIGDVYSHAYDDVLPIDCLTQYLQAQVALVSVTLVSVLGGDFEQRIKHYCHEKCIQLTWASSTKQAHGITSYYDQPTTLGSDRFVALVGAAKQFPEQYCIVVDCGTAVTIDGVSSEGSFEGGLILPGLQLWGQSLIGRTHQLAESRLASADLFARNTADAIGSGSLYGLVSAIDGICERMKQCFIEDGADESSIRLILCGGDSTLVAHHSKLEFKLLPYLVLMGLAHYI